MVRFSHAHSASACSHANIRIKERLGHYSGGCNRVVQAAPAAQRRRDEQNKKTDLFHGRDRTRDCSDDRVDPIRNGNDGAHTRALHSQKRSVS